MNRTARLAALFGAMAATASGAHAQAAGNWDFAARLYLYLADLQLQPSFPTPSAGPITIDASQLLDNLNFAAMGSFEANNGRFGAFTDLIYMNVGKDVSGTRDVTLGNVGLPAGVTADLSYNNKTTIWTLAAEARIADQPNLTVDAFIGGRMLHVDQDLDWAFNGAVGPINVANRLGSANSSRTIWDPVVGLKGQYFLDEGKSWSLPFYADMGAGGSDFTFQLSAGVSYHTGNFEISGMWRYIDYNLKTPSSYDSVTLNGPVASVAFHF